jgi:fermentation-respiration switch protein FrsA (DUF1100 family)
VKVPAPTKPTRTGTHANRPYELWLPDPVATAPPWPGIVILHGAGSRKESHADFARAAASFGWASIAYDQRGHGASTDEMVPGALGDVTTMARLLAEIHEVDPGRVCVRGSSMGGMLAIHAAAVSDAVAGAIAICPAREEGLLRALRRGDLEIRADEPALEAWLGEHDVAEAVELLAGKPLLLIHAKGDDQVPYTASEELYARASDPCKLILLPGGHHRSAQHDGELHGVALRWLERELDEREGYR